VSNIKVEWPDDLDALAAAPDHHEVLFESDKVRVLDSRVPSGDSTPVHTHRWPAVLYIIGESDFVRFDPEGNVIFDSRLGESTSNVGKAIWSPPLTPHYVKNVGDGEIRVISVEIKE
jgi:quercetin dioxygenase-like cupin family protein